MQTTGGGMSIRCFGGRTSGILSRSMFCFLSDSAIICSSKIFRMKSATRGSSCDQNSSATKEMINPV